MSLEFLRPAFLVMFPLALLVRWFPRAQPWNRVSLLRAGVLALLAVALAGPVVLTKESAVHQVLVLDLSRSTGSGMHASLRRLVGDWRAAVKEPKKAAVLVLGGETVDLAPALGEVTPVRLAGTPEQSSLSGALEAALRRIPREAAGAVTLVTDGLSTDTRWGVAVTQLQARGIPVKVVELSAPARSPRLVSLDTPGRMRVGQTARLAVGIAGDGRDLAVRLVDRDGRELARVSVGEVSERATAILTFEPAESGFLAVRAELIRAADATVVGEAGTLERVLAVQEPLRVGYLGERMQGGSLRLGEWLGRGYAVTDVSLAADGTAPDFSSYDVVVVDDRPASSLPSEVQRRLADAVRRDGLGLVYTGGRAAFGPGGYDQSPLAELLPVDLQQRAEKQDPSTSLVLIIDTSGSMAGTRIELAKQVARLAVRGLKAHDRIGIVEFYGNKHWALPLQSAANKIAVDRAIGRMQATGGTVLYPALEEAFYGLKNVTTRFKHIVLITDAGVEDADYESLVRSIAREQVNVSTVLVGAQAHSKSLLDIANWGNGRFYAASDRYALPQILLKQAATSNLPAYKQGVFPVRAQGGRSWWTDVDPTTLPAVVGYVETRARDGAEVLLEADGSGDPIVATWQGGAGRVTSVMTEPLGEGARRWRDWPEYGRWFGRLISRTAGDTAPFTFSIERRGGDVTILARRRGGDDTLRPAAVVLGTEAGEAALAFVRRAPDWFEANVPVSASGDVRVRVQATSAAQLPVGPATLLASPLRADEAPELQVDPAQALPLERLAASTGGTLQPLAAGVLGALPQPVARSHAGVLELWTYAALAALLLYGTEISCRRWDRLRPATRLGP